MVNHYEKLGYVYIYVASRVEVHKGRESSNSFGGFFRDPPNHNQSPLKGPDRPPGPLLHFSICGADHSECPHSVFSRLAALSHVKRIHATLKAGMPMQAEVIIQGGLTQVEKFTLVSFSFG